MFTAFKFFADALLHSLNGYRDDDTGELTKESVSLKLLDNYMDAFIGTFLLGSELYGIIKGATGFSKWYGLSLSGVDSLNDMIDSLVALSSTDYDLKTEAGRDKFYKKLWKAAKDFSTALGVPSTNIEKVYNAIRYHAEDIVNGEFGSYNAGYTVTSKQQKVRNAVAGGVTKRQYLDAMDEANTDGGSSVTQDELYPYLAAEVEAGSLTEEQADAIWDAQGWKKTRSAYKPQKASQEATAEAPTGQEPAKPTATPTPAISGFDKFKSSAPIYSPKRQATYDVWERVLQPSGMTLDRYIEILNQANTDGNDSLKQDELGYALRAAVYSGEMTYAQASAVWDAQGWKHNLDYWASRHQ